MFKRAKSKQSIILSGMLKSMASLTMLFMLVEFFDELNYGVGNAALPAIRSDLGLSYLQVGLLLGLPGILNTLIEPLLMLLGDTRFRKQVMLAGGLAITVSLLAIALTPSFPVLLAAMVVGFPASGAFVSLSQGTLMDLNPGREPHMMARWTVAGSLANLVGPLVLATGFSRGMGWRWVYFAMSALCLSLVAITWLRHIPLVQEFSPTIPLRRTAQELLGWLGKALGNLHLIRWMVLLQFSDLLLDVLTGYLALYFTDVIGLSVAQASLMMSVLMAAGLVSNIALIPALEKIPGTKLVRLSAGVSAILYAVWLLAPWLWSKIGLIILIRLVTLGWYEVLQGEAFASLQGRSGTVMAVSSLFGLLSSGISFVIGWVAARAGLPAAMWLLLSGPLVLVIFIPRVSSKLGGSPP